MLWGLLLHGRRGRLSKRAPRPQKAPGRAQSDPAPHLQVETPPRKSQYASRFTDVAARPLQRCSNQVALDFLHGGGQIGDLGPVLGVGGGDAQGQQVDFNGSFTLNWTPAGGDPNRLWTTQVQAEQYLSWGEFLVATTAFDVTLGLDADQEMILEIPPHAAQRVPQVIGTAWYNWQERSLVDKYNKLKEAGAQAVLLVANDDEAALLVREMAALPADRRDDIGRAGRGRGHFTNVERTRRAGIENSVSVDVPGGVVVDDISLMVAFARDGLGLAYVPDEPYLFGRLRVSGDEMIAILQESLWRIA